jgi:hypothetical protein
MRLRLRLILEYLSAFLLIALLLMAIIGVVVVKFYGDQLQTFVMEQVNQRLDSKVDVGDVSVKVFHKFPYTSLVLEDITVWSSHNFQVMDFEGAGADTLLTAERISISFNPFSLIRRNYNIRQLEIDHGILHMYTDRSGEGNYRVISPRSRSTHEEQQLNMARLRVNEFQLILDNRAKMLTSSGYVRQLELNGKFRKGNTQLRGSLVGFLEEVSNKGILYASEREIEAGLQLDVSDSLYTIESGHLQIDRILADVDGRFRIQKGKGVDLDLFATARDLEIHEVLDLLPRKLSNPLQEIRGNGILQLYTRVKGMVSSTLTPQIEADFQTSNANLHWNQLPFTVKSLNLDGTYSNGGRFSPVTTTLQIESMSAIVGEDQLTGSGRIRNFLDPDFALELQGNLHPGQWVKWYNAIPVYEASGTIVSDINISGSYNRQQPKGSRFAEFDISGGISMENLDVRINRGGIPFQDVNGTLDIKNDFWETSFSGRFGKSDFDMAGTGLNVLSFLVEREEELLASAAFQSETLDLQEILDQLPGKKEERNATHYFPDHLNLRLDFQVENFSKDKLTARHVNGTATYEAPLFSVDSLSMETMEGKLSGTFSIEKSIEGSIRSSVSASMDNLDIQQLFFSFNNFGQSQVTHEHLKGTISGTSIFSANFDTTFRIQPSSILNTNEVVINQGELNGFSPMMALSRFIAVEDLQNIQFERLNNTILIMDSQVVIPVMDIQSNALNLIASGTHGFNNTYDYRVQLKLSELLYNKARGRSNAEFEIAPDQSDTRVLFLKIFNDGSGSEVAVDRERTAQKIRNDLNEEKQELKNLLNSELGLFRQNREVEERIPEQEEGEVGFRFEFSDEPDTLSTGDTTKEKRRWWRRKIKKDTSQNKPAREFVIDE